MLMMGIRSGDIEKNYLLIQGPSIKNLVWESKEVPGKARVNCHLTFHLGSVIGVRLRRHHKAVSIDPQITGVEGKVHLG